VTKLRVTCRMVYERHLHYFELQFHTTFPSSFFSNSQPCNYLVGRTFRDVNNHHLFHISGSTDLDNYPSVPSAISSRVPTFPATPPSHTISPQDPYLNPDVRQTSVFRQSYGVGPGILLARMHKLCSKSVDQ
jgi:hypothetical protein